jgi:hypothetical protein
LELASVSAMYATIRLSRANLSRSFKTGLRVAAAFALTIVGSALFALALAWVKQGH